MNWKPPRENRTCYDVRFAQQSPPTLAEEFIEFWRMFGDVIVPANHKLGATWDCLHIVMKGPGGRMEVWPQLEGAEEPELVYWASIYIVELEDFYDGLDEDEFGSPEEVAEEMRWMRMLVDGAEAVHFADLAGFGEQGLPARFYVYDGDEPIWETVIGGRGCGKE